MNAQIQNNRLLVAFQSVALLSDAEKKAFFDTFKTTPKKAKKQKYNNVPTVAQYVAMLQVHFKDNYKKNMRNAIKKAKRSNNTLRIVSPTTTNSISNSKGF